VVTADAGHDLGRQAVLGGHLDAVDHVVLDDDRRDLGSRSSWGLAMPYWFSMKKWG
jgi:hypothetical protein